MLILLWYDLILSRFSCSKQLAHRSITNQKSFFRFFIEYCLRYTFIVLFRLINNAMKIFNDMKGFAISLRKPQFISQCDKRVSVSAAYTRPDWPILKTWLPWNYPTDSRLNDHISLFVMRRLSLTISESIKIFWTLLNVLLIIGSIITVIL